MKRKNILLINSSQVLMDITRKILERAGYSVRIAVGLAGAKELLMDYMPDGIVLENDLPDGIGLVYCRELRAESLVPIMFLSSSKDDELAALQAGANDFLKKPFDYEIFKARIGVMLNADPDVLAHPDEADEAGAGPAAAMGGAKASRGYAAGPATTVGATEQPPRPSGFKRVLTIAAACLMGVLLIVLATNQYFGRADLVEIPLEQIPLAESPFRTIDEDAVPYQGDETGVIIPVVSNITLPAGKQTAKTLLLNPAENNCYLTFEILLADCSETIYRSGFVKPGMCLEEITLAQAPTKGEHNAVMRISAYRLKEFTEISRANIDFKLIAN